MSLTDLRDAARAANDPGLLTAAIPYAFSALAQISPLRAPQHAPAGLGPAGESIDV